MSEGAHSKFVNLFAEQVNEETATRLIEPPSITSIFVDSGLPGTAF